MPINHASNPLNWSFRRFWSFCAEELGSARLQVNSQSSCLEEFCGLSQFDVTLLKDVLKQSYKRSKCKNLDSAIDLDATLDVLGETAFSLQGKHAADLLDIELLEEVGWCVNAIYRKDGDDGSLGKIQSNIDSNEHSYSSQKNSRHESLTLELSRTSKDTNNSAQVLSLKLSKLRRANSKI